MIAALLEDLERFLLPNACIVCASLISARVPDDLMCAVCAARMRPVGVGCDRCAQPLPPVGPCRFCAEWPEELSRARSAVWLDREASAAVHGLKYRGQTRLARLMAERMTLWIPSPDPESVLIPVPTTAARHRQRGYDQAVLLARAMAARWRTPVRTDVLVRVSDVGSQTKLTPGRRLANVAGAYCAAPAGVERRPVILLDDVLTTGATLMAAATALTHAGWTDVRAVTFARAEPYERAAMGH